MDISRFISEFLGVASEQSLCLPFHGREIARVWKRMLVRVAESVGAHQVSEPSMHGAMSDVRGVTEGT